MSILTEDGAIFLLRLFHLLAGVTWIGLLYYFNFVQVPYFGETKTGLGTGEFRKLVVRALWWFRWAALLTFLTGLATYLHGTLGQNQPPMGSWGVKISVGMTFGILMFLNVWLIIWPNQKVVIASADSVAAGGPADPNAAAAGARAFLASRTNTLFSIPMLFFMAATSHFGALNADHATKGLGIITVLALLLEANVLFGKKAVGVSKMLETVPAVVRAGLVLTVLSYLAIELTARELPAQQPVQSIGVVEVNPVPAVLEPVKAQVGDGKAVEVAPVGAKASP